MKTPAHVEINRHHRDAGYVIEVYFDRPRRYWYCFGFARTLWGAKRKARKAAERLAANEAGPVWTSAPVETQP